MSSDYYFICNNSFIGKVVHHKDCRFLRNKQKKFLGTFPDYAQAVATAIKIHPETDQCQACLEELYKTDDKPANKILIADSKAVIRQSAKPVSDSKSTGHVNRVPRKHL
ncbi:hypothetical protein [Raoultella planticola]|uniref:hypothetical protein n=1 Tax=Raoultella planticola TaxID=575 RepID=UPI003A4DF4AC